MNWCYFADSVYSCVLTSCWIIYCVAAWSIRMRCDVWSCGAHTKKIYLPNKLSSLFARPQIYLCEGTRREKKIKRTATSTHDENGKTRLSRFTYNMYSHLSAVLDFLSFTLVWVKSVRCSFIFIAKHVGNVMVASRIDRSQICWCCVRFSVCNLHHHRQRTHTAHNKFYLTSSCSALFITIFTRHLVGLKLNK